MAPKTIHERLRSVAKSAALEVSSPTTDIAVLSRRTFSHFRALAEILLDALPEKGDVDVTRPAEDIEVVAHERNQFADRIATIEEVLRRVCVIQCCQEILLSRVAEGKCAPDRVERTEELLRSSRPTVDVRITNDGRTVFDTDALNDFVDDAIAITADRSEIAAKPTETPAQEPPECQGCIVSNGILAAGTYYFKNCFSCVAGTDAPSKTSAEELARLRAFRDDVFRRYDEWLKTDTALPDALIRVIDAERSAHALDAKGAAKRQ